ncbi:MAG: thioredoxin domain-containing protein [Cyclobacteriaceae bacterium]
MSNKEGSANRLINSTSPYLLQHAHNPVDWYEWGDEALTRAVKENKPILVSIGYSSCHWCHVMERESFENKEIAKVMNENFVCIKVDREERPDIDQIYMDAVQAMGQNGGWPLNVFLTPDQKPFYGGTYFPPDNWSKLLTQITKVFKEKREEIDNSANELARALKASDLSQFTRNQPTNFTQEGMDKMFAFFQSRFDREWGGLDRAPKFVMPTQWLFLLRYYARTGNNEALAMVEHTLKKMAMGGLYDQVGGGFARYSVDGRWFAPHFEKMLYDNAQLLSLYAEAYTITKDEFYKRIIAETQEWLKREMTNDKGGFYSALDADSEGEEGKFYVWTKNEWDSVTKDYPNWVTRYYSVTDSGNWEHDNNILFITESDEEFAKETGISVDEIQPAIARLKADLLNTRSGRPRPGLDDKVLTGWNAMMVKGLCDAYIALQDEELLAMALRNIEFIEANLIDNKVYRSFKGRRSDVEGFLEDYAFLIQAYTSLYQATFDEAWLHKAAKWTNYVQEKFYDAEEGYFHFSSQDAEQLIARKKELFDNVIPSSNGVMAANLFRLGIIMDNEGLRKQSTDMISKVSHLIEGEPSYMSNWAILYSEMLTPMAEVVVVGKEPMSVAMQMQRAYIPFSLFMGTRSTSDLPLLSEKTNPAGHEYTIYVCYNKTCKLPVHSTEEALKQIKSAR